MKMEQIVKINEIESDHDRKPHLYRQGLGTFASSLISMCSGLTFGITAVMLPQLRQDETFLYDPTHDSWIASTASLSMVIGSLCCGPLLDSYGRKTGHIIFGIPFIVGWIFIACANSTSIIILGRFITGLSSGANKAMPLVYIGEIADPKVRALALFLPGLMSHVGVIYIHVIGHYLSWKVSAIICIIPAAVSLISFLFLKESPLWLIAKGRTDEGIQIFRWFRGTNEISENELKTVLERQSEKPEITARETFNAACSMSFIKPMLLLVVLMVNVQFSGVNVIVFYSQDILEQAFSGKVDYFIIMIVMDCIRAITALIICFLGNTVPRKIAFLSSSFAVSVFVFGLVAYFLLNFEHLIWIPLTCLVLYISFSSALVTIGWTFVPEVLPSNARGFGSGLNAAFAYMSLFIMLKVTPDFMNSCGVSAMFSFFGLSTLLLGVILSFILPETNGKTLQSIEDSYSKNKIETEIV